MSRPRYSIDNDITGTVEAARPRMLDAETKHQVYGVEMAEKHYKDVVYYRQRQGGEGWFHGRISRKYKTNYDTIKWNK